MGFVCGRVGSRRAANTERLLGGADHVVGNGGVGVAVS
jgi:hypothetical protein